MSITISSNRGKPLILGETQKMDDRPAIDTKRDKPGHVPAMSRFVPPHTGGVDPGHERGYASRDASPSVPVHRGVSSQPKVPKIGTSRRSLPLNTIAARQSVIGDTLDWIVAARRLRAAGYDDAGIQAALAEVGT
jgi:hypothetical protein